MYVESINNMVTIYRWYYPNLPGISIYPVFVIFVYNFICHNFRSWMKSMTMELKSTPFLSVTVRMMKSLFK